jgi:hypothetical protein
MSRSREEVEHEVVLLHHQGLSLRAICRAQRVRSPERTPDREAPARFWA